MQKFSSRLLLLTFSLLALTAYAGFPLWLDSPVRSNPRDPASPFFVPTATPGPLKVACVGDSITQGSGYSLSVAYPTQLQTLLGSRFIVHNYGVSGKTMMHNADYPYWSTTAYTNSKSWLPDIVVIMLGTNDSKPYNWVYQSEFVADAEELVNIYKNLPSHPRVYINTCPTVYAPGIYDITTIVNTDVVPLLYTVAADTGATLID
ncbi:MAG: GDSL-type esterase/lipase family protein, partial [candidate division FCPU426 bacterium]